MRIRLGWLGLGLWAASAHANLQLNFPLERLGAGDYNSVEFLSGNALLEVDGVAVARLAANQRVVGGSPVLVGLIWAYDSDPA